MHLALNIAELGISLISESLRQELCFAEVSQLALGFQQKGERQKLLLRLADIQIDNQLCNAQKPVLLANRGGAGGGSTDDVSLTGSYRALDRDVYVQSVLYQVAAMREVRKQDKVSRKGELQCSSSRGTWTDTEGEKDRVDGQSVCVRRSCVRWCYAGFVAVAGANPSAIHARHIRVLSRGADR